jgi:ADP-ribose pyrophosphatase YjhB (NUDIX family)
VLQDKKLLLVETMGVRYGPPGGSANKGENAQCAAERETFEESGVEVVARQLEHRFDNGFHLFWCDPVGSTDIAISRPIEVFGARWFAVNELRNLSWRYPEQDLLIENSVRRKMGLPQIRSHLDPIQ